MIGWEKIPNGEGWFHRPEYRTYVRFNSKGLRDQEHTYDKGENVFRILILGDSFVEGYSVGADELLTEVLEGNLNKAPLGMQFEVLNGGTSGYSTDQEFLFFREEGVKYKPDLVILTMFHNDIYYNTQPVYLEYPKPLFLLQDGKLDLTNVPVLPKREQRNKGQSRDTPARPGGVKGILKRAASHLLVYRVLGQKIRANFPELAEHLERIGLVRPPRYKMLPEDLRVFARMDTPSFMTAWAVTEAILNEFSRLTRASGAQLILFLIPDKVQLYEADWEATQKTYGISAKEWDLDKPNRKIKEIARRLGLRVLDPLSTFQEAANQGERLYYRQDRHWNAGGHRLAARIIHRYLINQNLIANDSKS
jgi:lysophospholipase L1-like esterase